MRLRAVFAIAIVVGSTFLATGYLLGAGKTSESSGYKILMAPRGAMTDNYNYWGSITGPDGIPKDFLNGCTPLSITTSPDPKHPAILILCKG